MLLLVLWLVCLFCYIAYTCSSLYVRLACAVCSALSSIPTVMYDLPDGQQVELGPERFRVAEALFRPTLLGVRSFCPFSWLFAVLVVLFSVPVSRLCLTNRRYDCSWMVLMPRTRCRRCNGGRGPVCDGDSQGPVSQRSGDGRLSLLTNLPERLAHELGLAVAAVRACIAMFCWFCCLPRWCSLRSRRLRRRCRRSDVSVRGLAVLILASRYLPSNVDEQAGVSGTRSRFGREEMPVSARKGDS